MKGKKRRGGMGMALATVAAAIAYAVFLLNNESPPGAPEGAGGLVVTFIDIGQGDSELIQQGGNAVLIDSGEYSARAKLLAKLGERGVESLDYLISTHPHADHMGAFNAVIDAFGIKHVMMPKATATTVAFEKMLESISAKGLKIESPVPGESVIAGNIKLDILAPNGDRYQDANNYSIIARLVWGQTSFLFTGDAEALAEKETLGAGREVSADVLKTGHHGSVSSTTEDFLSAVGPKIAVISCGEGNTYGHPHKETLQKFEEHGVAVYRTDTMGTITMRSDGANISVETEK